MTRQILWSASLILLLHSKLIQSTAYRATNISNTVLHDKDHLISSLNDTKTSVGGEFCNGEGFVPNLIRKSVSDFESQLQTIDQMVDDDATKIIDGSSELIAATNHVSEEMRKVICNSSQLFASDPWWRHIRSLTFSYLSFSQTLPSTYQ